VRISQRDEKGRSRRERRWTDWHWLAVRGGRWSYDRLRHTPVRSHIVVSVRSPRAGETTATDRPTDDLKAVTCNICQCKRTSQGCWSPPWWLYRGRAPSLVIIYYKTAKPPGWLYTFRATGTCSHGNLAVTRARSAEIARTHPRTHLRTRDGRPRESEMHAVRRRALCVPELLRLRTAACGKLGNASALHLLREDAGW